MSMPLLKAYNCIYFSISFSQNIVFHFQEIHYIIKTLHKQNLPYERKEKSMNTTLTNLEKDLILFYQATRIPFCVFDNTPIDLIRYPLIASMKCSPQTLQQCLQVVSKMQTANHLPILYSSDSCFIALLKLDEKTNVFWGPISSVPLTYKEFYEMNKLSCDPDDLSHLYRILQQSPHMNLTQFASSLSLFIKLAFREDISAQEILSNHVILPYDNAKRPDKNISDSNYMTVSEAISFQKKILYFIQHGNTTEIKKIFDNTLFFYNLKISPSSFEELRNIFFVYATICCVAVIDIGLDLQKAFPIFDNYISKLPLLTTPEDLEKLCEQISIDYCEQIDNFKNCVSSSPIVTQCLQYIHNNIYSRITINDLAKHCNLTTRTITRHFSQHYHVSVSEYILLSKLREAEFLLTHSTFSLAEISNLLSFSSQSHFTVAFKKIYFYTPQQYRERNRQKFE